MSFYSLTSYSQLRVNKAPLTSSAFTNLKSIDLDGIDDFCSTSGTYSELNNVSKLTISLWTKTSVAVTTLPLSIGTFSNRQMFVGFYANGRILFKKNNNTDGTFIRSNVPQLHDGNWNHVLVCVDLTSEDKGKIFFNGVDVTSGLTLDTNPIAISTGAFYVNESNKSYSGNLDEIAIYSGSDLRNNVSTIYNQGQPSDLNNNGLISPTTYYRCGDGDSQPIISDKNGSADLTMNNFNTFSSDVPT